MLSSLREANRNRVPWETQQGCPQYLKPLSCLSAFSFLHGDFHGCKQLCRPSQTLRMEQSVPAPLSLLSPHLFLWGVAFGLCLWVYFSVCLSLTLEALLSQAQPCCSRGKVPATMHVLQALPSRNITGKLGMRIHKTPFFPEMVKQHVATQGWIFCLTSEDPVHKYTSAWSVNPGTGLVKLGVGQRRKVQKSHH